MNTTTKKQYKMRLITMSVFVLIVFIAVAYAILQTNLRINGTTKISKSAWDIHFENVTPSDRGVSAESPATIDSSRTGVNFTVNLPNLGDFYEFYVDIVNSGNFDAKLESINTTNLTDEQKKYLDLEVSYSDGSLINIGDVIPSLKSDTIRVLVQYKPNPLVLPENTTPVNFNVQLTFVQDDGTGALRGDSNLLYNVLKNNAVMDTNINLGEVSSDTNGKGIYTLSNTASNANPIYYYRGAVDNNNVLFGGYCWKMIRTTDTGGIKMIYNGTPSAGSCNNRGINTIIGTSTYNNQSNPGYTYNDGSGNQVDSAVKAKIDDWFTNTSALTEYSSYLEDTPFYNERDSVPGEGSVSTAYASRLRIWGAGEKNLENVSKTNVKMGAASVEDYYSTSTSNGNGYLSNPVGLLTTDEIVLAGGRGYISSSDTGSNNSYYLYSNTNYWTMSPLYVSQTNANNIAIVNNNGSINELAWDSQAGIRPVIALKSGITYTEGDGTYNSPYQIKDAKDYGGDNLYGKPSLYETIKLNSVKDNIASEYVTGTNEDGVPGIRFGEGSSDFNGKGIYELTQTKEDGETIYYYRGKVENNYVEFASYCWRIIRTSSTKGVKLIYNGNSCNDTRDDLSIGNSKYAPSYNNIKYVGYTYLDGSTQTDSTVKTLIDKWYARVLTRYSKYLEDTPFYNERDYIVSTSSSHQYFTPYVRRCGSTGYCDVSDITIKLGAKNKADKYTVSASIGNGLLQYPVGLITSDELVMAGGGVKYSGFDTYLYTQRSYWTLSPFAASSSPIVSGTIMNDQGHIASSNVSAEVGTRPVVSLKPGTVYTTGDGTVGNPYVIATP